MPTSMPTGAPVVAPGEPQLDPVEVVVQSITLVVCAPLAPLLMLLVAVRGWPPWWLIVSGVLVAWTGEALWTLVDHTVTVILARRRARRHHAGHGHPGHRADTPSVGDPR